MAASTSSLGENVNFLYRAMVERDPHKRRVKPVDSNMLQLDFGDLGDSSDDSDYKFNENEDGDSDSNNSSVSKADDDTDDDDSDGGGGEDATTEDSKSNESYARKKSGLTVSELIEQARIKQAQARQRIASNDVSSSPFKILICAVCLGDISEEDDEIVECDSCGVSVHEGCYGITDADSVTSTISSSSTEPWFCEACRAGNKNPICELCPNMGGIFKETDVGKWVHIVCALYIPGVAFGNVDKLTPVTLFEMPYSKWGSRQCGLCEDERFSCTGVAIGCDAGLCRNYFHATCAQREGLLSEASHEEDIADPFFAYCKLHADKTIVRSKRGNWLAMQSQMRQRSEVNDADTTQKGRMIRKLNRHQVKFAESKNTKAHPWVPTQKMPRMLHSSPSACRKLIRKAELMGLNTQTLQVQPLNRERLVDVRKKWHIAPAFNVEFISYFLDRNERMISMQSRLDELLSENVELQETEKTLRKNYDQLFSESEKLKNANDLLRKQGTKLWKILIALDAKKRVMPDILHPVKVCKSTSTPGKKSEQNVSVALNKCGLCKRTSDQHLLARCDTCQLFYHLGCLDPPLTRMPKKTRLQGWQCSECDKSEDDEKMDDEFDPNAPRKLREHIKEPVKFTPPASNESDSSCSISSCGGGSGSVANGEDATPRTTRNVKLTRATRKRVKAVLPRRKRLIDNKKMVSPTKMVISFTKKSPTVVAHKLEVPAAAASASVVAVVPAAAAAADGDRKKSRKSEKRKRRRKMGRPPKGSKKQKQQEIDKQQPPPKKARISSVSVVGTPSTPMTTPMTTPKATKCQDVRTQCCQCEQSGNNSNLVRCDDCQKCYHFLCLDPPVKKSPKQRGYTWYCEDCDASEEEEAEEEIKKEVVKAKKQGKKRNSGSDASLNASSPLTRRRRKSSLGLGSPKLSAGGGGGGVGGAHTAAS